MMNFCTLFDSNYACKGIAMYLSLQRQSDDFVLYVMAMDRRCQEILNACGFVHIVVEYINNISSPELEEARGNRSRAEFCWTCGSFVTDYFLHRYSLPDITYLDSDLMFFCSPRKILDYLSEQGASVGLTPHFSKGGLFGRYCVQFVYFKNDDEGTKVLRWWRNECLKWCYSKLEDGKYGDQKYLDGFRNMAQHVVEIKNRGAGIAYWNMDNYDYNAGRVVYGNQEWPICFFHYSGVNVYVEKEVLYFLYRPYFSTDVRNIFIDPYVRQLKDVYESYLGQHVGRIVIKPQNLLLWFCKMMGMKLRRILPVDIMSYYILKMIYSRRKQPYSENPR